MSTLHVLATHRPAPGHAARLAADLMAAHNAGVDLGSRVPHIHAAGSSLHDMAVELQRTLVDLVPTLESHGVPDSEVVQALTRLVNEAVALADTARHFPKGV